MITCLIGLNGDDELVALEELKAWFGDHPIANNGRKVEYLPAPPARSSAVMPPIPEKVFQEVGGRIVIEAESMSADYHWKHETSEPGFSGEGYLSYMPHDGRGIDQWARGVLMYKLRINEPGEYRMALKHSHRGAGGNTEKWNQCYALMGLDPAPFGTIRHTARDLNEEQSSHGIGFTYATIHHNYGLVRGTEGKMSEPTYELTRGDHDFFIAGRSCGYRLDKIHFLKRGVDGFKDNSTMATPVVSVGQ